LKHPGKTDGLRHVALFVSDYEATEQFYSELFGMEVEWRPDSDNVYLTTGNDNLALHRRKNLGNSTSLMRGKKLTTGLNF
jgi:catechol 2,3-dioxygenase-like lactoylglutathione lyase family enzyme